MMKNSRLKKDENIEEIIIKDVRNSFRLKKEIDDTSIKGRLCIKLGIQERGTECGEWGECYIPVDVPKHPGECRQIFRRMSSIIPGNVTKHSGECPQIFRGISPNIPGNVPKHSGECRQITIVNFWMFYSPLSSDKLKSWWMFI